jgi:pimeloyl-ACP methyl ester carboxylesterase
MFRSTLAATLLAGIYASAVPAYGQNTRTPAPPSVQDAALVRSLPSFREGSAVVGGVRLHYVEGGKGPTLLLLPGWPQTWWSYHKVMPALARNHRVIVMDLRGMGASDKPAGGYDKKTMAGDVAGLVRQLNLGPVDVMGHDIGSMVAYSFAANHPELTRRLILLDVAPPDASLAKWPMLPALGTFGDKVGDGSHAYVWWFAYHQVPALHAKLAADGRIAYELEWAFHYLLKDDSSIDARDRAVFIAAYSSPDAIRAGDAWYQAFPQDIVDDDGYAPLEMPVLALGGPGYAWLSSVLPAKAKNVKIVRMENTGHFIPDEVPEALIAETEAFLK